MSRFASSLAERMPRSWVGRLLWLAVGLAAFWVTYRVGYKYAPLVDAVWDAIKAIFHVFTNPPQLPRP
jgi:hypothetical protein